VSETNKTKQSKKSISTDFYYKESEMCFGFEFLAEIKMKKKCRLVTKFLLNVFRAKNKK